MNRLRLFNLVSIFIIVVSFIGSMFYYFSNKSYIDYKIISYQNKLHRELVSSITNFSSSESLSTWFAVLTVSFLYGVFHAVGPGHGKAIITTYLATHRENIKKGIFISVASSLMQGVTAILMVSVLVIGLGMITRQAMNNVTYLEAFSFSLIAILGLYIFIRSFLKTSLSNKILSGMKKKDNQKAHSHSHDNHHNHNHHSHSCCSCFSHSKADDNNGDWKAISLTILSIGIRPCTGAVLILGASVLLGNFVIGLTAVLAMSMGTAIIVSTIAVMTIFFRTRIEGVANSYDKIYYISNILNVLAIFAGLLICILGFSMLHTVLTAEAIHARIF